VSNASEVIVHSEYCRDQVAAYYGQCFTKKVSVVRQHRAPVVGADRLAARQRLGVPLDAFLVCAFGFMDPTKLNHRLLEAWGASSLCNDQIAQLTFVGGGAEEAYAGEVSRMIKSIDGGKRIKITGYAALEVFEDYLAAADAAIQLRTMSRGETSRTVLDCLAYGVPLVINAHGPMAEYPDDVLIKLPDEFAADELVAALEILRNDPELRDRLAVRGKAYIDAVHAPALTVTGYSNVIERVAHSEPQRQITRAIRDFWARVPLMPHETRYEIARRVTDLVIAPRRPVIYVDISATVRNDLKTGIERVARALLREMLLAPPPGYLVVPVYLAEEGGRWRVQRAADWLSRQPGFSLVQPDDELVTPARGDQLMGLDLCPDVVVPAAQAGLYAYWRTAGAKVGFMVFDLLPLTHPEFFPPWAPAGHEAWVKTVVAHADQLNCISRHVQSDLQCWMEEHDVPEHNRPRIDVSYLGADVAASFPTTGLPDDADRVLRILECRQTFLMVGTLEPRKGHLLALRSFSELWAGGVDVNLVIVGHEGWKGLPDEDRRTIPETVQTIRSSPELGKRLFWLEGISDEYLEKVYAASDCLIAASEDEGFGLPLIEAFRHNIPVLARDIPVFREVGGDLCEYFSGNSADQGLVPMVKRWLEWDVTKKSIPIGSVTWLTWSQSAKSLVELLLQPRLRFDVCGRTKSNLE